MDGHQPYITWTESPSLVLFVADNGHHDDNWQLATLDDNPTNPRQGSHPGRDFFFFCNF